MYVSTISLFNARLQNNFANFPFGESLQRYQAPDVAAGAPFPILKIEVSLFF